MKTYIVTLFDRRFLEQHEGNIYDTIQDFIKDFEGGIMTDEKLDTFGYYELTDFMDMVNDQLLDNLTDTFIGYIHIKN